MATDSCYPALRKAILSVSALNERSLSALSSIFQPVELKKDDFFCREGEYPLYSAFLCEGLVYSYYQAAEENHKFIRGYIIPGMFLLPLPPFIYRNPSFLNFKALINTMLLQAKFQDLQLLIQADRAVEHLMNRLVHNEWIVNRELFDAGLHLYNAQTRCRIFLEKYHHFYSDIPREDILSYLDISAKQYRKYIEG